MAATAAIPRLLSPRNLSTSLDKLDKPLLRSDIDPAICVNEDDTAFIELSSLAKEASCLMSDELTAVDCSDCVRPRFVIAVSRLEIADELPAVAVVSEALTFVKVALIPVTDVASTPRLVLTFPRLALTLPTSALVAASVVLRVLRLDELALSDVESAVVEVLTPPNVELSPATEALTFPRLALKPVTEVPKPVRLVLTLTTDELTLMTVVLIIRTEVLKLPRLELRPIWLLLILPRLELIAV